MKQDILNSEQGIEVYSELKFKKDNTLVLYGESGGVIGKLQWSLRGIQLAGCIACRAPIALKKARNKSGKTGIAISLKGGVLRFRIKGNVVYEHEFKGECAAVYKGVKRFAFSDMSCENSFSLIPSEMEAGIMMTSGCGGSC